MSSITLQPYTDLRLFDKSNYVDTKNVDKCMKQKLLNPVIIEHMRNVISNALDRYDQVYIIFNVMDAVRNHGDSNPEIGDILPQSFLLSSYDEKIKIMGERSDYDDPITFKKWHWQQWPVNSIQYGLLTNSYIIYVEADYTYCQHPSIFAAAMKDTLYTHYSVLPYSSPRERSPAVNIGEGFYFEGDDTAEFESSLYCLGESGRTYEMIMIAIGKISPQEQHRINKNVNMSGDIEWAQMEESFLISYYDGYGSNLYNDWTRYIRYPWEVIVDNINLKVKPVQIQARSLTKKYEPTMATYVKDIKQLYDLIGNYKYTFLYVNSEKSLTKPSIRIYESIISNDMNSTLPLIYLTDQKTDKPIDIILSMAVYNSPIPMYVINYNITFDGTISNPIIRLDDGRFLTSDQIVLAINKPMSIRTSIPRSKHISIPRSTHTSIPTSIDDTVDKINLLDIIPNDLLTDLQKVIPDDQIYKIPSIQDTFNGLRNRMIRSNIYYNIESKEYLEMYESMKDTLSNNPILSYQQMVAMFYKQKYTALSSLPRRDDKTKIHIIPRGAVSFDDITDNMTDEDIEYSSFDDFFTYGSRYYDKELKTYIETNVLVPLEEGDETTSNPKDGVPININSPYLKIGDIIIFEYFLDHPSSFKEDDPYKKEIPKHIWNGIEFKYMYSSISNLRIFNNLIDLRRDDLNVLHWIYPLQYWYDGLDNSELMHISYPLEDVSSYMKGSKIMSIDNYSLEYIKIQNGMILVQVIEKMGRFRNIKIKTGIGSDGTKINENTILGILNPMTRSYAGISFADPDYIFTPENTLIIPIGEHRY